MAFDSKDTAAFKDVWVFCEQRDGEIMSISHQLLSEGRKLADDLGANLCGILLGKGIARLGAKVGCRRGGCFCCVCHFFFPFVGSW